MKKLFSALLVLTCFIGGYSQNSNKNINIDLLISKMTLEEKVGQMTQLTLDFICKGAFFDNKKAMEIDQLKLDSLLKKYHIGSILNTGVYPLTINKWRELIGKIHESNAQNSRLKIPILYGIDAIHGATYTIGATLMPQELALAATWNPSIVEKAAEITAYEVRASAIPWNFSPVLDLGRQPLWSRFFETFGEDPYLASKMGTATIKGYQGNDISNQYKVAACLKHFVGYSFPFSGKDRTPILMPERLLREYYLVPFQNAIKNGALTVMINSSEINGTPVHADYHILTEILKQELKFEGFAVTDWEDIAFLYNTHKIAASYKEAIAIAINAGIDMSMVPLEVNFCNLLIENVNEGKVNISRIDDAVKRILNVKMKLGLFEHVSFESNLYPKFGSAEFTTTNLDAALESITLLKNKNNILPLDKTKKVLVTGVGANSLNPLNGGWTHTWQGVSDIYNPKDKNTILEAIKTKIGVTQTLFVQGTSYDQDINIQQAKKEALNVDYVVICIGEKPGTEKPGDINDLNLDKAQSLLIQEIAKTGKPIILVLSQNRPRIISEIEPLVDGILLAYLPGNEGGNAISSILYGDINPSGKLPFTYPRFSNDLMTYDHKFSETKDQNFGFKAFNPQFEFGFGLSYTQFTYSNLTTKFNAINDSLSIQVNVTNSGKFSGKEVVQLFIRDEVASITPSVKRLRGFSKIKLKSNETKTVKFTIHKNELSFVDTKNNWVFEPGNFTILINNLNQKIYIK